MALTKISRGLLDTGVSDSSDATAITIDSSENVGIKTSSPIYDLQIGTYGTDADSTLALASATDGSGNIRFGDGTGGVAANVGKISYNHATNSMTFSTSTTEWFSIGSDGTLVTNKASSLLAQFGASNGNDKYLRITNSSGNFEIATSSTQHYLYGNGALPMNFFTNGSERMRIDSDGRVLLGTTSVGAVGGVNATHWSQAMTGTAKWCHTFKSSNSTPFGIAIKYAAIPNSTGSAFIYCEDGTPAPRFSVRSNGGVHNYSGNNVNLSDEREKKNIVDADNQLENIKNLLIKSFHYNEDDDSADKKLGVIAQEIETNLPHLISEYSNIDGEERKGVKEQQLMWMAIKAIQELSAKVEELESKINE